MNSPLDSLNESLRALNTQKTHIRSIRFPNYRNLEPGADLSFEHPITVLLGCNGTNKSSILHALYGSVRGKSIGEFWFETKLDAIPETRDGLRQSVVHQYFDTDTSDLVECLKIRYFRKDDPEYWEPAQHRKIYGFPETGIRVKPIQLDVRHFDFRGELPAFDKYFYFPDPRHLERRHRERTKSGKPIRGKYSKQDYLRSRSVEIRNKIEREGTSLTPSEIDILQYILERRYASGKVLKHSLLHGHEGWTILFKTDRSSEYSDAYAGSGESAATLLVHNILNAPDQSLVLLDEPETSLHPRAQQRMLEFLAHQAVRKRLQIVIATHSIHLAGRLPKKAIRVLQLNPVGNVSIETNLSAQEAFHEIGTFPAGKTILVEDERAKSIVLEVLKLHSAQASQEFEVVVQKGGTGKIYRDIKAFANSGRTELIILFDGDHTPDVKIPEDGSLPQGEEQLKKLIREITKGNNKKGPEPQKALGLEDAEEMIRYIRFFRSFVRFLPSNTPEHLVWDQNEVEALLGESLPSNILQEADYKKRLRLIADKNPGLKQSDTVFEFLLFKLLKGSSPKRDELLMCIDEVRSSTET